MTVTSSRRAKLGLTVQGIGVLAGIILYNVLPPNAGIADRLAVSVYAALPFLIGGGSLGFPSDTVTLTRRQPLVLLMLPWPLIALRTYLTMIGSTVSAGWDVAYAAILLLIIGLMVWGWWKARRARHDPGVESP